MGFYRGPHVVTDGLVLWLDAANPRSYPGSGTTWRDLVSSNSGSLVNGPTFNSANNGSIVFDGVDDYVNLGRPALLDLTTLTLSAWVLTTANVNQIVIGKSYLSSYYMNIAPNVKKFAFWTNGNQLVSTTISAIGNPAWCNIVATINNTSKSIYFNGIIDSSTTGETVGIDSNDVYVGNSPAVSQPFLGNISTTQIYNRTLSAQEVKQNYDALKGRYNLI